MSIDPGIGTSSDENEVGTGDDDIGTGIGTGSDPVFPGPIPRPVPKPPIPGPATPPIISRMGVSGYAYHQGQGEEPTSVELRFGRFCKSDEHPFTRPSIKVDDSWKRVEMGWLDGLEIGLLILQNGEGKFTQTIPTQKQRDDTSRKVIEVGVSIGVGGVIQPFARILPGESMVFQPTKDWIYVRAENPPCKLSIIVFPA